MSTLYVIRHAKAEEHNLSKSDFYRNIVPKGEDRARRIAGELSGRLAVDPRTLAITSPASRAIQTADLFCELLSYPTHRIEQNSSIYEAHFMDLLGGINQLAEAYDNLLLFGHNPGLSNLVNYLCQSEISLATSNVAILEFEDLPFSMISGGSGRLAALFD